MADCQISASAHITLMPSHGAARAHKTAAELAEDQILAALRGEPDVIPARRWLQVDWTRDTATITSQRTQSWQRDDDEAPNESSRLAARSFVSRAD